MFLKRFRIVCYRENADTFSLFGPFESCKSENSRNMFLRRSMKSIHNPVGTPILGPLVLMKPKLSDMYVFVDLRLSFAARGQFGATCSIHCVAMMQYGLLSCQIKTPQALLGYLLGFFCYYSIYLLQMHSLYSV